MSARSASVAAALLSVSLVVPVPALTQENLDFELVAGAGDAAPVAWRPFGDADVGDALIALDASVAVSGRHSLKLERRAPGVTRLAQRLPRERLEPSGALERVRLVGATRGTTEGASLWLRVALPGGVLFVDSRGDGQEPLAGGGEVVVAAATEWQSFELELPLPPDATELAFGVALRGEGSAWFDALRLERVAVDAQAPIAAEARRYVEAALELIERNALGAPSGGWAAWRRSALEYARGAETPAEAYVAMRYAVAALGDRHSYFQTPSAVAALRARPVANARTRQALAAPTGRALGRGVAYLLVPGFAGGTPTAQVEFAEHIKKIVQELDVEASCGWIVDLRRNGGGNLWPMLAGVGPLLGDGTVAASVYGDGRRVPVWYRDGQAGFGDYVQLRVNGAYRLARGGAPVAVLTGPGTGSSAEVLALAFRGREGARTFGAPTAGVSTGTRTFELADGAALVLAVAATSDRHGRVHEGPIAPDEAVEAGAGTAAADAAVDAARGWLASRDGCGVGS